MRLHTRYDGLLGAVIVALLVVLVLGVRRFRHGDFFFPRRTITILSGDTVTLQRNAPVAISTRQVGRLGRVERYPAGGFQTTIELKDDLPIYANAVLHLRQDLLGSGELVLEAGNDSAPLLLRGQAIPLIVEPKSPLALLVDSAPGTAARQ